MEITYDIKHGLLKIKLGWGDDAASKELALQTRGPKFVSSSIHMKVSCCSAFIISVLVGYKRQKDPWSLLAGQST